jgi:hypothetical protein
VTKLELHLKRQFAQESVVASCESRTCEFSRRRGKFPEPLRAPWVIVVAKKLIVIPANHMLCARPDEIHDFCGIRAVIDKIAKNP